MTKKLYSSSLRIQRICNKINKLLILYFIYLYFYDRDTNGSKKLFGIKKKEKEAFLSSYFQIISFISLVETVIFLVNASWIITDIRNDEPNE